MVRRKILWLVSWYPSRVDSFNGDFIQRHAQAVSLYHDVYVVFVVRDEKAIVTKSVFTEKNENGSLTEKIIYYNIGKGPSIFQKLASQLQYHKLFKKAIQQYIAENGKPDLVHVHVTVKAGAIAHWLKKKYGIAYVITEHWTGYLPEALDNFYDLSFYLKLLSKRIWKDAQSLSVVSTYLGSQLKKIIPDKHIVVIQNVVNTDVFKYKVFQKSITEPIFLHVTGSQHQKNTEAIVKAFQYVKDQNNLFKLHIIGPLIPRLEKLVTDLQLQPYILFHKEIPQANLATYMQQADALIIFSRYETFGCVVIEANACGKPVIASNIPALHEIIQEGVNGIFVTSEDEHELAEKIIWFINNRDNFHAERISENAHTLYNYQKIGYQFASWYRSVLSNK